MQLYYILYLCYISTYTTLSKVYIISLSHLNKMEYIHQHHPILHSSRLIWFVNSVLSSIAIDLAGERCCHRPERNPGRDWNQDHDCWIQADVYNFPRAPQKLTIFYTLICFDLKTHDLFQNKLLEDKKWFIQPNRLSVMLNINIANSKLPIAAGMVNISFVFVFAYLCIWTSYTILNDHYDTHQSDLVTDFICISNFQWIFVFVFLIDYKGPW